MKKIYVIGFSVLLLIIYIMGSVNIYLGSNSAFFNTAFDYPDAKWKCAENDIYAVNKKQTISNIERNFIVVTDNTENELFYLFPRGKKLIDIYCCNSDFDNDETKFICTVKAVYKKRFGKVYRFEISASDNSQILNYGQKLIFKRTDRA